MFYFWLSLLLVTFCCHEVVSQKQTIAVATFENDETGEVLGPFCLRYNPFFYQLPSDELNRVRYRLFDASLFNYCNNTDPSPPDSGYAVTVARGDCSFIKKAMAIQSVGGVAAIIVSSSPPIEPGIDTTGLNMTEAEIYAHTNITVALIAKTDYNRVQAWNASKIHIAMWAPLSPTFDYNIIVIFVVAVATVALGAWWSGVPNTPKGNYSTNANTERQNKEEEASAPMTALVMVVFVVLMCGLLVLLYFFYDYLVYVVIALFTTASAIALYNCLEFLILKINCCQNTRIPQNNLPLLKTQPPIVLFFIAAAAIAVAVFWAIERKASWAWILQDFLGFCFCLYMLRTIIIPKLMICAILLILLFFYDIFFVFITPLFTQTGQSVMVDVATGAGGKSNEQLPMVFKIPHLVPSLIYACSSFGYSLLGFGDILVPGLLVGFLHNFDMRAKTGHVYYIAGVIAYAVGLILCFIALNLMQTGQPALLYLVPCTLITTVVIGLKRRELKQLWTGTPTQDSTSDANNSNSNCNKRVSEENSMENGDNVSSVAGTKSSIHNESTSTEGSENENHLLLG